MNRIIAFLIPLFLVGFCKRGPYFNETIWILNNTGYEICVETNAYGTLDDQELIGSTRRAYITLDDSYRILLSRSPKDTSLLTIEDLMVNYESAFITISAEIDGQIVSKTWKYANSEDTDKPQLFNLKDYTHERLYSYGEFLTYTDCYIINITAEDLIEKVAE